MKNISLLPPEIRAQEVAQEKGETYMAYSIIVLLVFIALYLILAVTTWVFHIRANSIADERSALEREAAQYQVYEDLINEIKSTSSLASQACGTPVDWSESILNINRYIPANVWLTEMTCSQTEVAFKGTAFDSASVARWVETLKIVPGVTGVNCQFVKDLNDEAVNLGTTYEIKTGFSPGAAPQLKTEGGV